MIYFRFRTSHAQLRIRFVLYIQLFKLHRRFIIQSCMRAPAIIKLNILADCIQKFWFVPAIPAIQAFLFQRSKEWFGHGVIVWPPGADNDWITFRLLRRLQNAWDRYCDPRSLWNIRPAIGRRSRYAALNVEVISCVLSFFDTFDTKQYLREGETLNLSEYLDNKYPNTVISTKKLTNKIRTNKPMASFITNLMDIGRSNDYLNYDCVTIEYMNNLRDLKAYMTFLQTNGWTPITYYNLFTQPRPLWSIGWGVYNKRSCRYRSRVF